MTDPMRLLTETKANAETRIYQLDEEINRVRGEINHLTEEHERLWEERKTKVAESQAFARVIEELDSMRGRMRY